MEEIIPTKEEKKLWKQYLYNSLTCLSSKDKTFYPKKKDKTNDLIKKFHSLIKKYNNGNFPEQLTTKIERYSAWLVQEYNKCER